MEHTTFCILLCLGISVAAPADDPVRVDLPVYGPPKEFSTPESSAVLDAQERSDGGGLIGNLLAQKLQLATGALSQKISSINPKSASAIYADGFISPPVGLDEEIKLETEGFPSQKLSFKENLQHFVAGIFQPKPLVDTISEVEKYGNHGDKFYSAGRAIVGGAAGVSNLVNSVLEVPGSIVKKITRNVSEKLNYLGGKLIGLN